MDSLSGYIPVLFTRVPVPGLVKTRLIPRLGSEGSAILQDALIMDLVARISKGCDHLVLCLSDECAQDSDASALRDAFVQRVKGACDVDCDLHLLEQHGDGLGERVSHAMKEVFDAGAEGCALMGSDLPDVEAGDVAEAWKALAHCDVVLGPSEDGGYWVVALREPFPELFAQREFSTDRVLEDALDTCREHGKEVRLLRKAVDVDVPQDLDCLIDGTVQVGACVERALKLVLNA